MRKGLLAEWRRGIVSRGLATAALLAVPVAVAATIGFGTSLGGVSEGLGSLASGPDRTQASGAAEPDDIDSAIVALAAGGRDAAGPGPGGGPGGGDGGTGGDTPSELTPQTPPGDPGSTGSGGGGPGVSIPEVEVPTGGGGGGGGGGDPVGDLLDGVGNLVNGILGGG